MKLYNINEWNQMQSISSINEKDINSEDDFRSWAETVLRNAHGENFSQSIADQTIEDLILKYGSDGEWGDAIGALSNGLAEMMNENKSSETRAINKIVKYLTKYFHGIDNKDQIISTVSQIFGVALKDSNFFELANTIIKMYGDKTMHSSKYDKLNQMHGEEIADIAEWDAKILLMAFLKYVKSNELIDSYYQPLHNLFMKQDFMN